jgi:hypothetical protein
MKNEVFEDGKKEIFRRRTMMSKGNKKYKE